MCANGDILDVTYGRIGSTAIKARYPISQWNKKYNEKIRKGYVDMTHLVSEPQVADTGDDYLPIADSAIAEVFDFLRRCSRQILQQNYTISTDKVTMAMVREAQYKLEELGHARDCRDFNRLLIELFSVLPRQMGQVQNYLAGSANDMGKIVQREQDLLDVMRGQVAIGLYIKDAKDYGITVLPPDINKSIVYTAPTKNKEIRYGLEGLMDVGAAAERIVVERKNRGLFKSYKDLLIRCTIAGIDKGAIESLIKSGAIPKDIVDNRQEAVENLVQYMDACRSAMKTALKNDEDLNALMESNRDVAAAKLYELLSADGGVYFPPAIHFKEYDYEEMLKLEKEYTGFYISGHPLDKYEMTLRRYTSRQIAGLENDEKEVVLAGHITEFQNLRRKKDGKLFFLYKEEKDKTLERLDKGRKNPMEFDKLIW